jgi:hypothetical protein
VASELCHYTQDRVMYLFNTQAGAPEGAVSQGASNNLRAAALFYWNGRSGARAMMTHDWQSRTLVETRLSSFHRSVYASKLRRSYLSERRPPRGLRRNTLRTEMKRELLGPCLARSVPVIPITHRTLSTKSLAPRHLLIKAPVAFVYRITARGLNCSRGSV